MDRVECASDSAHPIIDANGDGVGQYNIYQYTTNRDYVKVGTWEDQGDAKDRGM